MYTCHVADMKVGLSVCSLSWTGRLAFLRGESLFPHISVLFSALFTSPNNTPPSGPRETENEGQGKGATPLEKGHGKKVFLNLSTGHAHQQPTKVDCEQTPIVPPYPPSSAHPTANCHGQALCSIALAAAPAPNRFTTGSLSRHNRSLFFFVCPTPEAAIKWKKSTEYVYHGVQLVLHDLHELCFVIPYS